MDEMLGAGADEDADARDDRTSLWSLAGMVAGAYAIGSVLQAAYIFAFVAPGWSLVSVWSRAAANAVGVAALIGGLALWRQHRRSRPGQLTVGVLFAAAVLSLVRTGAQVAFGVYPGLGLRTTPAELMSGLIIGLVSAGIGTWAMVTRREQREEARATQRLAVERALALRALEDEEVRVRRDVAEGLHATVQQRLVLDIARVGDVAERLRSGAATGGEAEVLDEVLADLEQVREQDVRGMSRLLYPDQLEVGLVPAVRALLRRVPSSIATRLDVEPAVRAADDPLDPVLTATERLLAVRVAEEGIVNALRHARPTSLVVALGLAGGELTVAVTDDGGGFDEADAAPSGTLRLAERLAVVGGRLELVPCAGAGARLVGRLPVAAATAGASDEPVAGERNGRFGASMGSAT